MKHAKLANGNGHEARIGGSASSAQPDQMNMPRSAGKQAVWKRPPSEKLSLRGRSGIRKAADRNQVGWSVAIAAAKTSLQVSSSGVIADAASASANAMARPRVRARLR